MGRIYPPFFVLCAFFTYLCNMSSGIYKWTNKETGHIYIGQAKNLNYRMKQFLNFNTTYAGNKVNEERIQYPNLKYWDYDILEECSPELLNEKEKYYIDGYEPEILLNIIKPQREIKPSISKPKWCKEPHLCPLSYMMAMKKSIDKIMKCDDCGIANSFSNIVKLIHDPRNKLKFNTTVNHEKYNESYIYDTVEIIPTQEVYDDLHITYGATISSWFILMKLGNKNKNPWVVNFKEEKLNMTYHIGGYPLIETLDKPIVVNKTFWELTKKYIKKVV